MALGRGTGGAPWRLKDNGVMSEAEAHVQVCGVGCGQVNHQRGRVSRQWQLGPRELPAPADLCAHEPTACCFGKN